jgi:hypothetical protein
MLAASTGEWARPLAYTGRHYLAVVTLHESTARVPDRHARRK